MGVWVWNGFSPIHPHTHTFPQLLGGSVWESNPPRTGSTVPHAVLKTGKNTKPHPPPCVTRPREAATRAHHHPNRQAPCELHHQYRPDEHVDHPHLRFGVLLHQVEPDAADEQMYPEEELGPESDRFHVSLLRGAGPRKPSGRLHIEPPGEWNSRQLRAKLIFIDSATG